MLTYFDFLPHAADNEEADGKGGESDAGNHSLIGLIFEGVWEGIVVDEILNKLHVLG